MGFKMETDFPQNDSKYLTASMFQDCAVPLTFKGWAKKANEDSPAQGSRPAQTWKQKLKFQLRYSYPEIAVDEAGDPMLGKNGEPFKNRHYDPQFPQGYSIIYYFEQGQLESGSLPLFNAFCMCRPKAGEVITIKRTGKDKETKWFVGKPHPSDDLPSIQMGPQDDSHDEYGADNEVPF